MITFLSSIREGVNTVHKNWQLVLLQIATMILSCMGFFIIVGIPIAVAFVMFGLDLTEILKLTDAVSALKGSTALLNKYFGMAVVIILSILIYMTAIAVIWVFTIAGSVGVLSKSIIHEISHFSLERFFREGKKLFLPMLVFSLIMGGIFVSTAFILGIIGGGASTVIDMADGHEQTLAIFLRIFFYLVLIALGIILILTTLSIAVFGTADLAFRGSRAWQAVKGAAKLIHDRPSSIGFYGLLLLGYIAASFLMVFLMTPFTLIPIIGPLLYLPYHLVSYAVQGYVNLIIIASVLHYYRRVTAQDVSGGADTSQTGEAGQTLPPAEISGNQGD
ncbi:MAG: hypothetical protein WC291_05270 [Thermodesulfovibrionales bacterium]|jgi:hypothetical protein